MAMAKSDSWIVIARLVQSQDFPAATAMGALRPLVANSGYIEAVIDTSTLVSTVTSESVGRIEGIARALTGCRSSDCSGSAQNPR